MVEPDRDPGRLRASVGPRDQRPGRDNAREPGVEQQAQEPIRLGDLGGVRAEHQPLPRRRRRARVACGGAATVVARGGDDAEIRVDPLGHLGARWRDHDQLARRLRRDVAQRADEPFEPAAITAPRDHNAHPAAELRARSLARRRSELDAVGDRRVRHGDRVDAQPLQVLGHGARLQLGDVALLVGAGGDAPRDRAPVVERAGDVVDALGPFAHPEHELEVLDRVEGRVEAPGRLGHGAAHDEQVADVHRAERVGRRPVGLEERVGAEPVRGELVRVRVDDVEPGVDGERLGDAQQGVRGEHVVVVQEGDVLTATAGHRRVGGSRDPAVALTEERVDARIGGGGVLEEGPDGGRARPVVGRVQLPLGVELAPDRVDRLLQVARVGLVRRHHHRDQGPRRQRADLLDRGATSPTGRGQFQPGQPQAHQAGVEARVRLRRRSASRSGRVSFQLSDCS